MHQVSFYLSGCRVICAKMGKINTAVATIFVALLIFNFAEADSELNGIVVDKKGVEPIANNNSSVDEKVGMVKKADDQKGGLEVESKLNSNHDASKQLESTEGVNGKEKAKGDEVKEVPKGERVSEVADKKKEKGAVTSPPVRKESSRNEECDSSAISCTDDKRTLVACLRVPGNESPELSLFIQNKGKSTLGVTISAPDFVKLEKEQIQIPEKEDKKVMVTIRGEGPNNFIVLKAGNGNCSLDFKDLIVRSFSKEVNQFTYLNLLKPTPSVGLIVFAAVLLVLSPLFCIKFRKTQLGNKYQKLDMELPVSSSSKTESGLNDGWDNSWGDDSWDDEEAPKTPSLPVTPSLSSKGIASRRLSKEGWKD